RDGPGLGVLGARRAGAPRPPAAPPAARGRTGGTARRPGDDVGRGAGRGPAGAARRAVPAAPAVPLLPRVAEAPLIPNRGDEAGKHWNCREVTVLSAACSGPPASRPPTSWRRASTSCAPPCAGPWRPATARTPGACAPSCAGPSRRGTRPSSATTPETPACPPATAAEAPERMICAP